MSSSSYLPSLNRDSSLSNYLSEIRKFPLLEKEEEFTLARKWHEAGDRTAAHKLVTSHLRLVAKIALGYKGYGLPVSDLISEGNIGMMQAVKKFDPDKGFRLATYAMWWIRASIQEYILHSWSLVKIGTTAAQKKLFFNLRKLKSEIEVMDEGDLAPEDVKLISDRLDVSENDVIQMNRRLLASDHSLNSPLKSDSEVGEWQDWLTDTGKSHEQALGEQEELDIRKSLLKQAITTLNEREQEIFKRRRILDPPETLEELSQTYDISRERVRQVEVRAFQKIQHYIQNAKKDDEIIDSTAE